MKIERGSEISYTYVNLHIICLRQIVSHVGIVRVCV